jgi:hypothetical protein
MTDSGRSCCNQDPARMHDMDCAEAGLYRKPSTSLIVDWLHRKLEEALWAAYFAPEQKISRVPGFALGSLWPERDLWLVHPDQRAVDRTFENGG